MEIQVNEDSVRAMVERLRASLGKGHLAQSKAYEALAHTLGYRNWDTLSAKLGEAKSATPPAALNRLAQPLTVYVSVRACSEWGDSPTWASFELSDELLAEMLKRTEQVKAEDWAHLVKRVWCVNWHDPDEMYSIDSEMLYIDNDSFWYKGLYRHSADAVETRAVYFKELLAALESKKSSDDFYFEGDKLVVARYGDNVQEFVDELREAGALSAPV